MNFGIAYIQKKTIQKRFIYPLVLALLLVPFLYFSDGSFSDEIQLAGSRIYRISSSDRKAITEKRAEDAWYETGRSVREPERSVRRSSVIYSGLCMDTAPIQLYSKEICEQIQRTSPGRLPEPGRSNWSLRAPPVYVCNI